MRKAEEIAQENKLDLSPAALEYLDRYMRLVRMRRIWVDDDERGIRIEEIEFALKSLTNLDPEQIFLFEQEALREKYHSKPLEA